MTEPIENPTPDLSGSARLSRLRELNSRFQKLMATGITIHQQDPKMIKKLFPVEDRTLVLAMAERTRLALEAAEALVKAVIIDMT